MMASRRWFTTADVSLYDDEMYVKRLNILGPLAQLQRCAVLHSLITSATQYH